MTDTTASVPTATADIGLVGLAVMGENLVLNLESRGFTVAVHNRTVARIDDFLAGRAQGRRILGGRSAEEFVALLKKPRAIMIMVRAGSAVDDTIELFTPYLEPGDILIDGGNSHYLDTERRASRLADRGLLFVGTGVSGGEEGALNGPSVMPGGHEAAWPHVGPMLQAIAARTPDGTPCCDWVGAGGAGHFVKMVHNGIEYADMQMIGEAYHLMRDVLGLSAPEMSDVFARWNTGRLGSYLIEITANILAKTDDVTGLPLVDLILDTAGQKGTGKWTSEAALTLGVPAATIAEAVFARAISALKDERVAASRVLEGPATSFEGDKDAFLADLELALYASKICSYAQGFALMGGAAREYGWRLDFGRIAHLWREGCIIRAVFLDDIHEAYMEEPRLPSLLLAPFFQRATSEASAAWRRVVSRAVLSGVPVPAFSSALSYFDAYRSAKLPANLLQAQRDYFGAHQYERTDAPRGQFFHTDWTGEGGVTASSTYNV
ncbi:decarboxylating NADP(+)-dependent phosphogluconate dehydrogenase [Deinococcus yavapaiensis]|uniref:6-phosphogluconate dehydrogenase, decarboxylating n=1 Tax=Deinococcus yavapaiensis KR-236 TaxID=694435 RepID=A0A318S1X0_9DEIO|nr:decarboxylating NADP(+)-dependent phosphogluconate dehydrogenase [Deinococcus yavapaiensis]PYE49015.1 6-phosphogluconate dehydrogenase [Deinococcus yavapaiensis KR-236]